MYNLYLVFSRKEVLAFIQSVDPQDVNLGQTCSLANIHICVRDWSDTVLPPVKGEGFSPIVHDGGVVIGSVQIDSLLFVEVEGLRRINVVPVDPHVLVTVAPRLLMLEAQCVEGLVLNHTKLNAAPAIEREDLSTSLSPKIGPATVSILYIEVITLVGIGDETNAGLGVERFESSLDHPSLIGVKVIGQVIGNGDVSRCGVFRPPAPIAPARHGVSGSGYDDVSLNQHLTGTVVGV